MTTITEAQIDAALPKIENGLRKYCWIQAQVHERDVGADAEFQKRFNGFYRIRSAAPWRKCYYTLMEASKLSGITFVDAIRSLHRQTRRVEASFASKLVATLHPEKPVIDRFVLGNFKLRLPYNSAADRVSKAIVVYNELCEKYSVLMASDHGKMILAKVQQRYSWAKITDLKKIDLVLWQIRP